MDSLYAYIQDYPLIQMDEMGNITVSNNAQTASVAPAFCCHLDTVHGGLPEPEVIGDKVLISLNGHGVGGDDKCGVIACLEMLKRVPCKAIFFREEEKGCIGSKAYDAKSLENNLFCIEIDRRNGCDVINNISGTQLCSEEFSKRFLEHFKHGKLTNGMMTDVIQLDKAEINMLNVSSGYYNPHTSHEYVLLDELYANILCLEAFAKDVIKNPLKKRKYKRSWSYAKTNYQGYTWQERSYYRAKDAADELSKEEREGLGLKFDD